MMLFGFGRAAVQRAVEATTVPWIALGVFASLVHEYRARQRTQPEISASPGGLTESTESDPPKLDLSVSLTETDQYRRLVEFLVEVQAYAQKRKIEELNNLVLLCRADMRDMYIEEAEKKKRCG